MPALGKTSNTRLDTCDVRIQRVFREVITRLPWTDPVSGIIIDDMTIIEGHRNEERQNYAFEQGFSKKRWPDGKHNTIPAMAVDAAPYHPQRPHIHWSDIDEMEAFSRLVLAVADELEVPMRWGADWDRDGVRGDLDPDETLLDGPHYELV